MVYESRAMRVVADEDGMVMDAPEVMNAKMMSPEAESAPEEVVPEENFDQATIRENFAETAFFLPHLVSDKRGDVNIQFTLPESLT